MGAFVRSAEDDSGRVCALGEIFLAPRTWVEQVYPNLIYFHEAGQGGHFAAWEQPQLFTEELRAGFRSLR